MSLKIHPFWCDDQVIKNVKPIISELFDMLLENIEVKRKKENYLNNILIEKNKFQLDTKEQELNPNLEQDEEQKRVIMSRKVRNEAIQERIKIVDREITILDGQMRLRLGIIASLIFGNQSVLVFKQWNENYSEISQDYGLLCSSSNINSNFITKLSVFREIEGSNKNNLVFEMKQEISELQEKTFLLCLSDSITSNHSIYITKLSFSSYNDSEEIRTHTENNYIQLKDSEGKNELEYYEFLEMDKEGYDQILVRTRVPNDQKCSNFKLILLDNHKNLVGNGNLLSETNMIGSQNICFWSLKLENSQFKNSDLLEIVQRHRDSGAIFPVSIVKLLPLNHENRMGRSIFSNSTLFKVLFLILNLIPITLLTFGVYIILIEIWTIIPPKLFKNKKYLINPTLKSSRYQPRANNCGKETFSNTEKERNISRHDNIKETKPVQLSNFDIVTKKDLNSEESGLSSGENEQIVKDDPFRYFDSDCSISTHTGI
ncbi:uncharacterized protein cubi_02013 [Cryptosporidium ubiquitum]|uniref:Uncharacterized protein n=1 Tax=Cryptosporidium ubiquitum TaxID=857276 RepID=A0A1J4MR68_9CRYT|nr:uncharacterized protein cubi_02013 [Cryptosporidium ubiquitum]OII75492.1 hypothetical protein cubi_02013 [Cryptosporidium ubiquitum]